MTVFGSEDETNALRRVTRTVVVIDLVESVRLIEADEDGTVRRWQSFVSEVAATVLPACNGRLVKSLGDGLMLEFIDVPSAIRCAAVLHGMIAHASAGRSAAQSLWLRIGVHASDVLIGEHDIYGRGVNLAARLATLAEPGQTVVSAATRDGLIVGFDAEVQDLGDCYLKHIDEPVHAFRIVGRGRSPKALQSGAVPALPGIAVIPFRGRGVDEAQDVVGEIVADAMIARLSTCGALRVVSRLSTSVMRHRMQSAQEIGALLDASFVVSGTFHIVGDRVIALAELADGRTGLVLWAGRGQAAIADILQAESELADALCAPIMSAICSSETRRSHTAPLPTLDGYSLQLAATQLMHRSSRPEFERGREVLEHLVDRYPRAPLPHVWLAKWYVLRVTRGLVGQGSNETARALDQTRRAVDAAPECALALAVEGFVHCHMLRDLDAAEQRLDRALDINPSESLAWLFKCVVQGFRGDGEAAMESAERAIALSPLDPMRHYYDGLAASAALAAHRLDRAIEWARRSLQVNRSHLPTLRALAIAQVEQGSGADARETAARIIELDPELTVAGYRASAPKGAEATRSRYAAALRDAGIPAH